MPILLPLLGLARSPPQIFDTRGSRASQPLHTPPSTSCARAAIMSFSPTSSLDENPAPPVSEESVSEIRKDLFGMPEGNPPSYRPGQLPSPVPQPRPPQSLPWASAIIPPSTLERTCHGANVMHAGHDVLRKQHVHQPRTCLPVPVANVSLRMPSKTRARITR